MPHLTQLLEGRDQAAPFHTFEFFPPRTGPGVANLLDRIQRLAAPPLQPPLAVSVTWGAGGSTADRTLEIAESIVNLGIEVILHLTCTNMPKEKVDTALSRARTLGITNILALRGDAPRGEEYADEPQDVVDYFQHADDLVRYIRKEHGDFFCVGVAGYPTPHPDSENAQSDLQWLKNKCDAGADFIVTQLFYDLPGFEQWVRDCRAAGINVPIIPGVMPIQNYSSFRRLVNLTQCPVPQDILNDLEPIKSDDAAVKQYGARLATKMIERLLSSGLVQGVHLCTLNLEKSVRTIMENLGWVAGAVSSVASSPRARLNQLIADDDTHPGMSIRPSEANELAQWGLTRTRSKQSPQKTSVGAVAGEDSWDEFPNGRFTDVRSPAYGEIDGWGSGLKTTPAQALRDWGAPATPQDLATLFQGYLRGEKPTTPFCDLPLSPESDLILQYLLSLNSAEKQHWTVGSQPAVDAAPSADPMHGWGPPGGYVFQKAFVEIFVPLSVVEKLEVKIAGLDPSRSLITMYASNRAGEYRTNSLKDDVNSVTWAVFPGQEIVTSTIIEEISFIAWKEEAFDMWAEWALLYPRGSAPRKLIEQVTNEWWLVSLIHHDYKDKEALWKFLLE